MSIHDPHFSTIQLMDAMEESVAVYDREARVLYLNPVTERIFGATLEAMRGRVLFEVFPEATDNLFHQAFLRVVATGQPETFDHYYEPFKRWYANRIFPFGDRICCIARDITEHKRNEEDLLLMVRASEVLSTSLEYRTVLRSLTGLLVPTLADWCLVDLRSGEEEIERLAFFHRDPTLVERGMELSRRKRALVSLPNRIRIVFQTGESLLFREVRDEILVAMAYDEEHLTLLRSLGLRSMLCVPLTARGQVLGAISLAYAESGRNYDEEALRVVEELARRAALAVDNARLFQERTRLYDNLSEREDRLRLAVDSARLGTWDFDPRSREMRWDVRCRAMFGLAPRSPVDYEVFLAAVHPEDRDRVDQQVRRALTFESGGHFLCEYRTIGVEDGIERWVLASGRAFFAEDGTLLRFIGIVQDISERKRTEENLHFLAEASAALSRSLNEAEIAEEVTRVAVPGFADGCAFHRVDDDGSVRMVAVHHRDPAQIDLIRRLDAQHPIHREDWHGHARVLRSGSSELIPHITDQRLRDMARDEAHLTTLRMIPTLSSLIVPILRNGEPRGTLTFGVGDSHRVFSQRDQLVAEEVARRVATALENARLFSLARAEHQRAEEAGRLKDEFLATLSHELRTPLSAIMGWLHLLKRGEPTPDKLKRALETIERNSRAQLQLVDDLLDISRVVSGKLRLSVGPVDLRQVIEAAADVVRPSADARSLRLEMRLEDAAGPVSGDADRLQQVAWNLLTNAVKFTPVGGRIDVHLERTGDWAQLSVRDSGQGISRDFLPHIFERFRQADGSFTRAHGGLGLGLAIVRHLVEMHGGTVEAWSQGEGHGSTFVVRLPLLQPRQLQVAPLRAPQGVDAPPGPSGDVADLAGLKLLVIDDEPDAREMLLLSLEEQKARVVIAASAAEGFTLLKREHPDVIICDIGMPGEDGLSFIRRVRALPPEAGGRTPAIALTAYARAEDRTNVLRAGFDLHVPKPVDLQELTVVIRRVMG